MDERQRRLAANEARFRAFNEGVREAATEFSRQLEFVCECGRADCDERIELGQGEYERLRSEPERFAVRPGHELLEVETVVERRDAYFVIEKKPGEPAELARATDPRR